MGLQHRLENQVNGFQRNSTIDSSLFWNYGVDSQVLHHSIFWRYLRVFRWAISYCCEVCCRLLAEQNVTRYLLPSCYQVTCYPLLVTLWAKVAHETSAEQNARTKLPWGLASFPRRGSCARVWSLLDWRHRFSVTAEWGTPGSLEALICIIHSTSGFSCFKR